VNRSYNRSVRVWVRKCASFEEEAEADREYYARYTPDERLAMIDELRNDLVRMLPQSPPPNRDHADLLAALQRHDVRALVVGAHALAIHAKPRYTKDLDLFVEPTAENARKIIAALADFGFGSLAISEDDFASPGRVVQLGAEPNRIDLMTSIDAVDFSTAWSNRVGGMYAGQQVFFIGKEDLMRNKAASGRHQDLADLDLLRRF
jgi:hypothetical protein